MNKNFRYILLGLSFILFFSISHQAEASMVVLHNFSGPEGQNPNGSLIESKGKFYGMTTSGGENSYGVIFQYDLSNKGNEYSVLHNFTGTDGSAPIGSLVESGGKFYGMTSQGGSIGYGVIFEYDPSNIGKEYSVLHNFDGTDGRYPEGSLVISNNKLYGLTTFGGSNDVGVFFQYDPSHNGKEYSVLHDFAALTGVHPNGSPIVLNGKFYGAARDGGPSYAGVLFQYNPSHKGNEYSVLHNFTGTDGTFPGRSFLVSNNKIYGLTYSGSLGGYGVIFQYDLSNKGNEYSVLHTFNNIDGSNPGGSLIKSNNIFYGMAEEGGSYGHGAIYQYDPSNIGKEYSVLHNFDYYTNGGLSRGSLYELNGKFYGTVSVGGVYGGGVIFEFTPNLKPNYSSDDVKTLPIQPKKESLPTTSNLIQPHPAVIKPNVPSTTTNPLVKAPVIAETEQDKNLVEYKPWYTKLIESFSKLFK